MTSSAQTMDVTQLMWDSTLDQNAYNSDYVQNIKRKNERETERLEMIDYQVNTLLKKVDNHVLNQEPKKALNILYEILAIDPLNREANNQVMKILRVRGWKI